MVSMLMAAAGAGHPYNLFMCTTERSRTKPGEPSLARSAGDLLFIAPDPDTRAVVATNIPALNDLQAVRWLGDREAFNILFSDLLRSLDRIETGDPEETTEDAVCFARAIVHMLCTSSGPGQHSGTLNNHIVTCIVDHIDKTESAELGYLCSAIGYLSVRARPAQNLSDVDWKTMGSIQEMPIADRRVTPFTALAYLRSIIITGLIVEPSRICPYDTLKSTSRLLSNRSVSTTEPFLRLAAYALSSTIENILQYKPHVAAGTVPREERVQKAWSLRLG